MSITSFDFFMLLCVYCFLYHFVQSAFRSHWFFLLFNLVFIHIFFGAAQTALIVGFCLIGYSLTYCANEKWSFTFPLQLAVVLLVYATIKKYSFLPLPEFMNGLPEIVGVSYVIFRMIDVLTYQRENLSIKTPPICMYMNYCLSFCTLISGPIQRYHEFSIDYERASAFVIEERTFTEALRRIANGLIKVNIVSSLLFSIHSYFNSGAQKVFLNIMLGDFTHIAVYEMTAISYLVFLYFNFSGYSDLVIGIGKLFGYRLPENFDKPFDSSNFLEFWSRWHMSLSFWFRDFVFNPVVKLLVRRWRTASAARYQAVFTYFLTFFLLGVWHGRNMPFVFCGLALAFGASVNKLFQLSLLGYLGPAKYITFGRNRFVGIASIGLASVWISIAITGMWLPWQSMVAVATSATVSAAVVGLMTGSILTGTAVVVLRECRRRLSSMSPCTSDHALRWSQFGSSVKLALVAIYALMIFKNAPIFVYQAF